ncbi:MAG TPA: helix-turn-helix domain-containing protein [Chroococcales cyanobacterium]|jgi:excisionase family DNA binding protein
MSDANLNQLREVFPGRTALRPREVCEAFGFGLTYLYALFKSQEIRPMRFGRVTLVPLKELAAWMDRAATAQGGSDAC